MISSKTEGERGRSLSTMTCSSFFDGQVGHNLCPKKCLTTSKMVMCGGGVFKLRDESSNECGGGVFLEMAPD